MADKVEKYGRFTVDAIQVNQMIDLVKFQKEEPELYAELAADYPAEKINYFISVSG